MIAMSSGVEPLDEVLRAPSEPRRPGVLDEAHRIGLIAARERNSRPPSIRSSSSRRSSSSSSLDPRVRRVARHLLDAEVPLGEARDLREVRDRDHLRALGEPAQRRRRRRARSCRRCPRRSRRRRASRRRRPRRSRARRARARRPTPSRRPGRTGGRGSGGSGRRPRRRRSAPGSRSRSSTRNSPSPMPTPRSSAATAAANGSAAAARAAAEPAGELVDCAPRAAASASAAAADRVEPAGQRSSSRLGRLRASQQLLVRRRRRKRRFAVGDALELAPRPARARPGSASSEARKPRRSLADLAEPQRQRRGARRPRARAPARAARAARPHARRRRRATAAPSPSSGASASRRSRAASASSVDVAQALALGAQRFLRRRLEAVGLLDERPQLARGAPAPTPRRASARRAGAARPRARARPTRSSRAPAQLLLAGRTRRARRAGTRAARAGAARTGRTSRSGARRRGREVLARDRAAPRVRARAPVGEDAAREHEPVLVLGRELGERRELRRRRRSRRGGRARPRRTPRRAPGPTAAASPRAPSSSPIACARIVFPAPVSPVIAFSPGASASSASRIRTRFSMRRLRSKASCGSGGRRSPRAGSRAGALLADPRDARDLRAGARPRGARRRARRGDVGRAVPDDRRSRPRGDDERAGVQRVRRDEGDRHRVEAPDEHRAAVREVVGGRAGRGSSRSTRRRAGRPSSSPPTAHSSSTIRPTSALRDDDVVDGDAPLAAHLDLERRQLDDRVLAGERAREPGLELAARDRGEEADAAEVDADHRDARAEEARRARGASSRRRRARPRDRPRRRPRARRRCFAPRPRDEQLDAASRATARAARAPARSPAACRA